MNQESSLTLQHPERIWLVTSPAVRRQGWEQSRHHTNAWSRNNSYLNYICTHTLVPWLSGWLGDDTDIALPNEQDLQATWALVCGSAIAIGGTRLALVPHASDASEALIPREWLEGSGRADYVAIVRANLQEAWLCICGVLPSDRLVADAERLYDPQERAYRLDWEECRDDFNRFLAELEPRPRLRQPTAERVQLSPVEQEQLRQAYQPRLVLPFEKWAQLLASDRDRCWLYRQRTSARSSIAVGRVSVYIANLAAGLWHDVEQLLPTEPVFPVPVRGASSETSSLVELLATASTEPVRQQAAIRLGQLSTPHPEAIAALEHLLATTKDETTRWQAALSLGKLAPDRPQAAVRKARAIDLGPQRDRLALLLALAPKSETRASLWLQVRPIASGAKLDPGLQLSVASQDSEIHAEVAARGDRRGQGIDWQIQLRFSPPPGAAFQVSVSRNSEPLAVEDIVV